MRADVLIGALALVAVAAPSGAVGQQPPAVVVVVATPTPTVDLARDGSEERNTNALRELVCRARVIQAKLLEMQTHKRVEDAHRDCPGDTAEPR